MSIISNGRTIILCKHKFLSIYAKCVNSYNIRGAVFRNLCKFLMLLFMGPFIFLQTVLNNLYFFRLEYLEVFLTSKCTLNCKDCLLLIPYHKEQKHEPSDSVIDGINRLVSIVPIRKVALLGGEPFLYPDLVKVLDALISNDKVKKIEIATNGTIIPSDAVLARLKNKKVTLRITSYKVSNDRAEKFRDFLASQKVSFLFNTDISWLKMGKFYYRERIPSEHKKVYQSCKSRLCITLFGGRLYPCSPIPRAVEVGFVPEGSTYALDIFDEDKVNKKILKDWYYKSDYFPECCYCSGFDSTNLSIEAGVQMARNTPPSEPGKATS